MGLQELLGLRLRQQRPPAPAHLRDELLRPSLARLHRLEVHSQVDALVVALQIRAVLVPGTP